MSKEEMLQPLSEHYNWADREQQRIEDEMGKYAKEVSIGFEDWKRDNAIVWDGKWGEQYYQKVAGQPLKSNPKNSSELYQLYLNHLQSKATT